MKRMRINTSAAERRVLTDLGECSGLVKEGLFSAAFDNGMRVQVRVQRGPAAGAVLLVSVPERYPHACPRVSIAATGVAHTATAT
ncbi:hypothetical protein FNF27_01279 [Cafeteria roenbergensis]|uniref:RWD domain-containing protein n=1 Tax=Cafeteria roenbergensis TaxID=33653 RepID=A0A5A8EJ07_CAFRO|nr:hypothetical protein FNF27_01279 [Cafeteria roenbergensis]